VPAVVFVAEAYFPGDRVGSYCSIQRAARKAGFQVAHLEGFGRHYRTTMLEFTRHSRETRNALEWVLARRQTNQDSVGSRACYRSPLLSACCSMFVVNNH
jgi:cyclopropane fatty-acyl-phospholipid synthase-like methyltransferase